MYSTAMFRGMATEGSTLLPKEERRRGNEFKLQPKEFKLDGKILLAMKIL